MVKPESKQPTQDAEVIGFGSTIRAVELETGISAMTLRDWEKRFGFPAPERRPGSDRRLYSAADVERLKLIKQTMGRGYRIGDVVGKTNVELTRIVGAGVLSASAARADYNLEELIRLLAAENIAEFELQVRAASNTQEPRRFVTAFVEPLLNAVGLAWEEARLSVRHEHLASEYLTTELRRVYATLQPTGAKPVVLLGTLPGEVYSLPLLIVAVYLASLGVKTHLLGSETPVVELADAARAMGADVVGLSISRRSGNRRTAKVVEKLRRLLPKDVEIWMGGAGATSSQVVTRIARTLTSWEQIEVAVADRRAKAQSVGFAQGSRALRRGAALARRAEIASARE
jgi:methanogenic corrinoid protein MtbC1